MIFILDNLDSFTYNIYQQVRKLGEQALVKRARETSVDDIRKRAPQKIIISPGPGKPSDHPFIFEMLDALAENIPMLGVCLGFQAINQWCGGSITKDSRPTHGKTSVVIHNGGPLFCDVPSPFEAARYHSLYNDKLGKELLLTAWTDDRLPMAAEHLALPLCGVQFHPESFLTPCGQRIMENFLRS